MTTDFQSKIANLERQTAYGFVFVARYTISASDGIYSSSAYGSIGLKRPDTLIPFDDLTEEIVVGWVKEKFGAEKVAEIEAALQAQIDEKTNPTKAAGVPWSN
jgi:hypothetical protein